MLTPTTSSHQQHVDTAYSLHDLPPFSLPKFLGEEGEFMPPGKGLDKVRDSQAGFIGRKFTYLVANKL